MPTKRRRKRTRPSRPDPDPTNQLVAWRALSVKQRARRVAMQAEIERALASELSQLTPKDAKRRVRAELTERERLDPIRAVGDNTNRAGLLADADNLAKAQAGEITELPPSTTTKRRWKKWDGKAVAKLSLNSRVKTHPEWKKIHQALLDNILQRPDAMTFQQMIDHWHTPPEYPLSRENLQTYRNSKYFLQSLRNAHLLLQRRQAKKFAEHLDDKVEADVHGHEISLGWAPMIETRVLADGTVQRVEIYRTLPDKIAELSAARQRSIETLGMLEGVLDRDGKPKGPEINGQLGAGAGVQGQLGAGNVNLQVILGNTYAMPRTVEAHKVIELSDENLPELPEDDLDALYSQMAQLPAGQDPDEAEAGGEG